MTDRALIFWLMSLCLAGRAFSQSSTDVNALPVPDISTFGDFQRPGEGADATQFFYSVTPTIDNTMTDYVRDPSGQWISDDDAVDPSAVTVQIQTPTGPYRVRFSITVDGVAFRAHQAKGIDLAFEHAKKPKTKTVSAPSKRSSESSTDTEGPKVAAKSYRRSDVVNKLSGYVRAQSLEPDSSVDAGELQWMVTQWLPGSRVLISEKRFGLQHRSTASLLNTITQDDSSISLEEVDNVIESIVSADENGDKTVQLSELRRTSMAWWTQLSLLSPVEDTVAVDFNVGVNIDGDNSTWTFVDVKRDRQAGLKNGRIVQATPFGSLNVMAVRDDRTAHSHFESGQFSIASVLMPNPLFAFADTRADGRLDMQEINALPKRLRTLDQNRDGEVTATELPAQVTLIVSQGPWANRLATQVSATPMVASVAEKTVPAPSWFTGMDANMDGLLARDEFLGDDDQFKEWDKDSDGMIGSDEVMQ